jgi:hypothetical protein
MAYWEALLASGWKPIWPDETEHAVLVEWAPGYELTYRYHEEELGYVDLSTMFDVHAGLEYIAPFTVRGKPAPFRLTLKYGPRI